MAGEDLKDECSKIERIECCERDGFVSITYRLQLSSKGKGAIVFNTSLLEIFTIGVKNNSNEEVIGYLEISPDRHNYWVDKPSLKNIPKEGFEIFVGKIFMKYTCIGIEGPSRGEVYIYFQGQYAHTKR